MYRERREGMHILTIHVLSGTCDVASFFYTGEFFQIPAALSLSVFPAHTYFAYSSRTLLRFLKAWHTVKRYRRQFTEDQHKCSSPSCRALFARFNRPNWRG